MTSIWLERAERLDESYHKTREHQIVRRSLSFWTVDLTAFSNALENNASPDLNAIARGEVMDAIAEGCSGECGATVELPRARGHGTRHSRAGRNYWRQTIPGYGKQLIGLVTGLHTNMYNH